ncbi:MAG: hypothetical protein H6807_02310 [Planctomycetes bacterium]|nr:hypothetical protein [Planctomycetota bacterium]
MKSATALLAIVSILALSPRVEAQPTETARRVDIEHLLEFGFGADDIIAWLGEKDRRIEIDAGDLAILEKAAAPATLLDWLRKRLPVTAPRKMEVADVVALWKEKADEAALLEALEAANREWILAPADVLSLAHAGIPRRAIDFMRGRRPVGTDEEAIGERLDLDDILKMTADGLPADQIIKRIEASPSRYEVDAQRILELKRDGVALDVLQAVYRKRADRPMVVQPAAEGEMGGGEEAPASTGKEAATQAAIGYDLLDDKGVGFSMLRPMGWVDSKELMGTKSLVQLVDPSAAQEDGLPDLEMSVMTVHPRRRGSDGNPAQLESIAQSFIETLAGQFKKDGIDLVAERPQRCWLSAQPALLIETNAVVKASSRNYRGAFYVLQARDRIWVLSYSCRLEQSTRWLPILKTCLRSFALAGALDNPLDEAVGDRRDKVTQLFEIWRRSLRRFDFKSYRAIHEDMTDDVDNRRRFLALAGPFNDESMRLEIDGIDFERNQVNYNVWGLDNKSRSALSFLRLGESYRLTLGRP